MLKKLLMLFVIPMFLVGCTDANNEEDVNEETTAEETEVEETEEEVDEETEVEETEDEVEQDDSSQSQELPAPREEEGDYSAEGSSINTENLHEYFAQEGVAYIDLRDYEDYAKMHFKNFEVIPFFATIFNEEALENEEMIHLFGGTTVEPEPVYTASEALLNEFFPEDKTLFLMCQSGARSTWMMEILDAHGYDMNKIYNIGGLGTYTASEYEEYITNTEELSIEVNYDFAGLTRN